MGHWLATLALACGLGSLAAPAVSSEAVRSWQVDAQTRGLLIEDHRAPLVFVRLEFAAGDWSPWLRLSGAGRAFEIQLYDRDGTLRNEVDRLGVDVSLTVGRRAASLRASCLRDDLNELLHLIRRLLRNGELDRRELRRRRREDRLSWELSMRDPRFRAHRAHAELLFEAGDPRLLPYERGGRVRVGVAELAAARDRLLGLAPRRIAFAGALTLDEAVGAAERLLPPATAEDPPGARPRLLPMREGEGRIDDVEVRLRRLTQVYFSHGRASLPYTDPEFAAFLVADHVLGGHFYSRLSTALRHQGGETYGAFSSNRGDVESGLYELSTFTHAENAAAAERELREVLELFHAAGITEEERVDAVGFLTGRLAFGRRSPEQMLDRRLRERRLGLPEGFLDAQVDRAASLELDEINDFIGRFFDPSRFRMVRVVPAD
jgi:predicted Zn-dependent peptidase